MKNDQNQHPAANVSSDDQATTLLEQLQAQLAEKDEAYRRVLADYQNLSKRTREEKQLWIANATEGLLLELLPTLDHLELALQHFSDPSLKMITDELRRVLSQNGLEHIDVAGKKFDAGTMEVVEVVEGNEGEVVKELQPGYKLGSRIIRHAKVVVGGQNK